MARKSSFNEKIGYLFIALGCLLSSGYAYSLVLGPVAKIVFVIIAVLGCWMIKGPNFYSLRKIRKDYLSYTFIFLTIGILISYFTNMFGNNILDHILILSKFYCALAIALRLDFQFFRRAFVNGMVFFTLATMIIWGLLQNGINIPTFEYIGLNNQVYCTVWVCSWSKMYPRFMGPFWEPGLFASFLIFAIVFEACFSDKKPRVGAIVICIIGVILTESTAGYLLLVMAIYIWFRSRRRGNIIVDIFVILTMIVLYFYVDQIIEILVGVNEDVFAKLTGGGLSYDTRKMSPVACFLVFLKNPIFGNGYSIATNLYNEYKTVLHMDAMTSTSGFMLAAFGICGIWYTVGLIGGCLKYRKQPWIIRIMVMLVFLFVVNKEPQYNNMLTSLLLCEIAVQNRYVKDGYGDNTKF